MTRRWQSLSSEAKHFIVLVPLGGFLAFLACLAVPG